MVWLRFELEPVSMEFSLDDLLDEVEGAMKEKDPLKPK